MRLRTPQLSLKSLDNWVQYARNSSDRNFSAAGTYANIQSHSENFRSWHCGGTINAFAGFVVDVARKCHQI